MTTLPYTCTINEVSDAISTGLTVIYGVFFFNCKLRPQIPLFDCVDHIFNYLCNIFMKQGSEKPMLKFVDAFYIVFGALSNFLPWMLCISFFPCNRVVDVLKSVCFRFFLFDKFCL